jgi:TonB family protein
VFGAPDFDPSDLEGLEKPRRSGFLGLSDRKPFDLEGLEEPRRSGFLSLFDRDDESEEEAWPYGGDPKVIFFLNERVSPRPLRIGDRRFIVTIILALLFHLVLLLQLRSDSLMSALIAAKAQPRPRQEEPITPFYFVEMPNQKQEKSSKRRAPLSDMDRRAHGGEGAPADTPGSRGNTPELRLTPPGGMPAGQDGRDTVMADTSRQSRATSPSPGKADTVQDGQQDAQKLAAADPSSVLVMPKTPSGGESGGGRLRGLSGMGPGAQGGFAPSHRGGHVDVGPLSFDTQWYEWGPYAAEMLRRIRYHWEIPEIAALGVGGVVRIRFYIERDGRVSGLEIERESGHPSMDFAARDAILNASPLPPLPPDLTGVEREGVTIAFYYNLPIPESGDTH